MPADLSRPMRHHRLERCSLALLLFRTAASASAELITSCGPAAGCLDSSETSLHLLQSHALHLDAVGGRAAATRAAAGRPGAHPGQPAVDSLANATLNATDVQMENADPDNPLGVTLNSEGDLTAFASALVTNLATMAFCVVLFMFLRVHYPLMYSGNVVKENHKAPSRPDPEARFSWLRASLNADAKAWIEHVGMDNAMLLEFSHLCMKMLLAIGLPMCCIMAPLHFFFGGKAAGPDHMSYFSVGNVEYGSWIYTVHAFVVWFVVCMVTYFVFQAQNKFVHWRFEWLKGQANIRANTILVTGISKKRQSDDELRSFFEQLFPGEGRISSAYIAKDTRNLPSLVAAWKAAKKSLYEAQETEKETGVPVMRRDSIILGQQIQATVYFKQQMENTWAQIQEERKEILEASKTPGSEGYNCASGFVTFASRGDAETALRLDAISKDQDKWEIQSPPEPKDVRWDDLTQDPIGERGRAIMGYLLLAGLFVGYLPIIIALTRVAEAVNLGPLQPFWDGLAPTFGLTFMICFLPTFLIAIGRHCFTLKADSFAQHRLQAWYFWFQVVFVILVSAIGKNVTQFLAAVIESPLAIFRFLGETMPSATHFYMNFTVLQWSTHVMNMLRYINLAKFLSFRALYSDEEAADMAEPEDQDYYGVGSRNARWSITLMTGLVYGSLCPPMYVLCVLNFLICRVVYGYLIPFAETRKPDTGGYLWVTSLQSIFVGLGLYVVLMTGVLYDRASSNIPSWIAVSSLIYIWWSKRTFDVHYAWERLPLKYAILHNEAKPKRVLEGEYRQPELYSDYEEMSKYMAQASSKAA